MELSTYGCNTGSMCGSSPTTITDEALQHRLEDSLSEQFRAYMGEAPEAGLIKAMAEDALRVCQETQASLEQMFQLINSQEARLRAVENRERWTAVDREMGRLRDHLGTIEEATRFAAHHAASCDNDYAAKAKRRFEVALSAVVEAHDRVRVLEDGEADE